MYFLLKIVLIHCYVSLPEGIWDVHQKSRLFGRWCNIWLAHPCCSPCVFFGTSGLFEVHPGCTWSKSRWWFQIFCFTILGSSWSNLTVAYFSNGLKLNHQRKKYIHEFLSLSTWMTLMGWWIEPGSNENLAWKWVWFTGGKNPSKENQFSRAFLARTWPPTIVTKCFIPFYSYICRIFRVCSTKKGWFCSPIAYLKQVVSRMEDGITDAGHYKNVQVSHEGSTVVGN